jgi:hypothetical protein
LRQYPRETGGGQVLHGICSRRKRENVWRGMNSKTATSLRFWCAIVLTTLSTGVAAEDCPVLWYWNGAKCEPLQIYLPNERDYWTRFFPEKGYPSCTPEGCCPTGFTIQDKLCKPYFGR